ncbi:hypothetical protein KIH41_10545 [Litoribacter ruber]|uniref:hypothetical protein n=1 Tax=Litoribacter ruber TaxID=702568 RepID=UPI001BDAF6BB|nr:hypothetical protein [Litoribacter ruber]MBT0811714.1 hypothetical protein [Litoribacter ruber]
MTLKTKYIATTILVALILFAAYLLYSITSGANQDQNPEKVLLAIGVTLLFEFIAGVFLMKLHDND